MLEIRFVPRFSKSIARKPRNKNYNEIFIDKNLLLVLGWDAKQRIR